MRVLVVGGAGYLGGVVTDLLAAAGHEPRVFDALLYEDNFRKDVPFVCGDVRDRSGLLPHLGWADVVVWLAAIVGDGACAISPLTATEVNCEAVGWLANHFDGRILFTSTCSVYGARDDLLTERADTSPLSLYAATKLQAEESLSGRDALVFRLGTLYGLGDDYARVRLDLVVNTLTARAVTTGRIRVFGGGQWRPLLHVADAARAIVDAAARDETGVVNLASVNARIIDVADRVIAAVPGTVMDVMETSFEDARNYRADTSLARSLGFASTLTVDDGIREVRTLLESGRIPNPDNPRWTNRGWLSSAS